MKKLTIIGLVLFLVIISIGNLVAKRDKDLLACEQKFKDAAYSDYAKKRIVIKSYADSREGLDAAYGGTLEQIVKERDAILKRKNIIGIAKWEVSANIEVRMEAIYVPLPPWNLIRFK